MKTNTTIKEQASIASSKYGQINSWKLAATHLSVITIACTVIWFNGEKNQNSVPEKAHDKTKVSLPVVSQKIFKSKESVSVKTEEKKTNTSPAKTKVSKTILKKEKDVVEVKPVISDSHSIDKVEAEESNLFELYKKTDKQFQVFNLKTDRDTVITCKEGTKIGIKANSFALKKTGESVNGKIELKVKEYYKIGDLISSNLNTVARDGILETGGTLYIEAVSENEECMLQEGKNIELGFPHEKEKEEMQLFSGQWNDTNVITWSPEKKLNTTTFVNAKAQFPGGEEEFKKFVSDKHKYPKKTDGLMAIDFTVKKDGSISNIKAHNRSGWAISYNIYRDNYMQGIDKEFKDEVIKMVQSMPTWIPAKRNGKNVDSQCNLFLSLHFSAKGFGIKNTEIGITTHRKATIKVESESSFALLAAKEKAEADSNLAAWQTATKLKPKLKIDSTLVLSGTTEIVSGYIFGSTKLGWINCDRFVNDKRPKTNYIVKLNEAKNTDVKIIFHSVR